MELLRFLIVIFLSFYVSAQTFDDPMLIAAEEMLILGPSITAQENRRTYAAIKDLTIRPFRKRPPSLLYQVELDNFIFNISLQQNNGLTTPGCLVHYDGPNGQKILRPCNRENHRCFYTGKSDSHSDSWVAADVCNGLKGVLSIGNLSYYFDPLTSTNRINGEHVHAVYRFHGDKRICPVADYVEGHIVHASTRRKRADTDQSAIKYVEARVVIDPYMLTYHGGRENVENYMFMTVNIANSVLRHKSLGQVVQIVVDQIYPISNFTHDLVARLTNDADQSLKEFCAWETLKTKTCDANILFTRRDLKSKGGEPAVNGYSYNRGICNPSQSCLIAEDQGPIVGITVAHELGHLLGMKHDSMEEKGIMNAAGWSGDEAYVWSKTSAEDFYKFATRKPDPLFCLRNTPFNLQKQETDPLPAGVIYSADEQCKMMYDKNHYFDPDRYNDHSFPDLCRNLLCDNLGSSTIQISTPMLEGTDCNNRGSWCMSGKCVPIDMNSANIRPVHGQWSEWTPYSNCSRKCDGGIKERQRLCNEPLPQFGGKLCDGNSTQYQLCNLQPCGVSGYDDRMSQCLQHQYAQCQITQPEDCYFAVCPGTPGTKCHAGYFQDGTKCLKAHDSPYNRCVLGKCMRFGCDGLSDSTVDYDRCGVCGGDGSTCHVITGSYSGHASLKSYFNVVTIPMDSFKITVQDWNLYCFLSISIDGTRLFNDNGRRSLHSFDKVLSGIRIKYSNIVDRIEIAGPIPVDIVIQVFQIARGLLPNVTYTYSKPHEQMDYFAWATIENSTCSQECGTGEQSNDIKCMSRNGHFIDDRICGIDTRPAEEVRACSTRLCPPRWVVSPWSECSVPCGLGKKTRNVTCVMELKDGSIGIVDPSRCSQLDHPIYESPCYITTECFGQWFVGNWSECPISCGEGYITRTVECRAMKNGRPYKLTNNECELNARPDKVAKCYRGPCYVVSNPDECTDNNTICAYYSLGAEVCGTDHAAQDCAKTCGICTSVRCDCYDKFLCEDPLHADWMHEVCPHGCGLCGDCRDCSKQSLADCNDPYQMNDMKKYCAKTCGFCY